MQKHEQRHRSGKWLLSCLNQEDTQVMRWGPHPEVLGRHAEEFEVTIGVVWDYFRKSPSSWIKIPRVFMETML